MSRMFGTVVRGVRAPIFREGDDVVKGTVDTVLKALKENSVEPHDKDVVAITESVVARTQGNYATVEQIAADVKARTGGKSFVDVITEDGVTGRIAITQPAGDWQWYINGEPELEYFELVPYAG